MNQYTRALPVALVLASMYACDDGPQGSAEGHIEDAPAVTIDAAVQPVPMVIGGTQELNRGFLDGDTRDQNWFSRFVKTGIVYQSESSDFTFTIRLGYDRRRRGQ
ncbi:hypothetical protein ACFL0V_05290 [Nanoarchaeota archaeon]